jgi:DNA modification methylase
MRVEHIGNATLYLGDCREVLPTLGQVDAVVTDPPYGIEATLGMGGGYKGDGGMWAGVKIVGDESTQARDQMLDLVDAPFAAFGSPRASHPKNTRAIIVWDKGEHVGAGDLKLPWKPNFELVFVGGSGWTWHHRGSGIVKANAVAGCVGDRNTGHRHHPFEKPVSIMAHFCERAPGGIILDPFMGSGTTGIACANLGRPFIGIEIKSQYFDTACRRIEAVTSAPRQEVLL